jgi:hypothetical protein
MTARRVLEIRTNDRVWIAYRDITRNEDGGGHAVMAYNSRPADDPDDWLYMSGAEVEALHQFTYDILAGPTRDPRLDVLDAHIVCGETDGSHECCLESGHPPLNLPRGTAHGMHVTSSGVVFPEMPF